VCAPACLRRHGIPTHPLELSQRPCIAYAYQSGSEVWRFRNANGELVSVRPMGPLRVNNGDAMLPSLIAVHGLCVSPEFLVRQALADDRLQIVSPKWQLPAAAGHLMARRTVPSRNASVFWQIFSPLGWEHAGLCRAHLFEPRFGAKLPDRPGPRDRAESNLHLVAICIVRPNGLRALSGHRRGQNPSPLPQRPFRHRDGLLQASCVSS
jgi:hypothetical protein